MPRKDRPPLPPYIPVIVKGGAERLECDIKRKPEITQIDSHKWIVVLEGEHIRLTMTYAFRRGSGMRSLRYKSTLHIDGEPHPLAQDYKHFIELWRRHEEGKAKVPIEPLEQLDDIDSAPLVVRKTYNILLARIQEGMEVSIWQHEGSWIIGLNFPDHDSFARLTYAPDKGLWTLKDVRLVSDGVERSVKSETEIMEKLMAMMGMSQAPSAGPGLSGSTAPPGTSNSVAVRRSTVIRN